MSITGDFNVVADTYHVVANNLFLTLFSEHKTMGAFPDGQSAAMLMCARLRYMETSMWGQKKHMNMKYLEDMEGSSPVAGP